MSVSSNFIIASTRSQQIPSFGSIRGQIFNTATHEAIPGANIVILGSTLGSSADTNGNFIIQKIPAGSYEIRASAVGFEPVIKRG